MLELVLDALADAFLDDSSGIVVAKVDGTDNRSVCLRFGVSDLPMLNLFADGQMFNYQGTRSLEPFLEEFILGGYKNTGSDTVPPPLSWFQQILSQNDGLKAAAALVAMGVTWGTLFSIFNGIFIGEKGKGLILIAGQVSLVDVRQANMVDDATIFFQSVRLL
jgi:hypothetical protein